MPLTPAQAWHRVPSVPLCVLWLHRTNTPSALGGLSCSSPSHDSQPPAAPTAADNKLGDGHPLQLVSQSPLHCNYKKKAHTKSKCPDVM
jgi:hypothetical protein